MVIDLRRQAETLKDTLRVEDRNFAYNVEKIKDLNKKRVEGDVIDTVFDKIYDSLSLLQAEIKSKNKPDVYDKLNLDCGARLMRAITSTRNSSPDSVTQSSRNFLTQFSSKRPQRSRAHRE